MTGFSTGSSGCAPRIAWAKLRVTSISRRRRGGGAAPPASRVAARRPRPKIAEDVVEVPAPAGAERVGVEAEAAAAGARAGVADEVVVLALLGVGERLVGDGDLLEAALGRLVAGVAVGWYSRASFR